MTAPVGPQTPVGRHRGSSNLTPGALYPGGGSEDATMLIQRISDAGLNEVTAPIQRIPAHSAAGPTAAPPTVGSAAGTAGDAAADMRTGRTSGVVRAGLLMAVATLASRATGFLSKVILLSVLGAGLINDAYTTANTLPNIVFELLIGGVLTSVAIPLLSRARNDPDGGIGYTQRLMTIAVVGLVVATGLAIAAAPLLTRLYLSGGTTSDPALATELSYLLLPQIFFYGLAALFGAILNTKERFAAAAWAPLVNNLVVIGVGIALIRMSGGALNPNGTLDRSQLLLLGVGTTAGIVLQAVVMLPSLRRSGFRFTWRWGGDHRLAEAGRLMLWAVGYVLISQVGYVVMSRVASAGVRGGITVYSFTSLLFQLPYGILGVSVLTAVMPRMSRHAAAGQIEEVKRDAALASRLSAVALAPAAAAMVALSATLAFLGSSYGSVSDRDVDMIGGTLAALAIGLVPLAVTLVQMRVFYAMKDGRTPTIINGIMVAVRVPLLLLCVQLRPDLLVPGLAAATTVSYLVGAVVGEIWLRARYGSMGTTQTLLTVVKMAVASGLGGLAAWFAVNRVFTRDLDSVTSGLLQLLVGAVVGLLVIAVVAAVLRVRELDPVRRRVLRWLGIARSVSTGSAPVSGTLDIAPSRPATVPAPPPPHIIVPQLIPRAQVAASLTDDPNPGGGPQTGGKPGGPSGPAANQPIPGYGVPAYGTPVPAGPPVPTPAPLADRGTEESPTVQVDPGATQKITVPQAPFAPGSTVGGRYRLVSLVTTDTHGNRFWRAKDTVLPRDMAVTLLPDGTAAAGTVARTLRVGRLHHIGLPQTLDVGTDHGQSYVVGQWVDGATLADLLVQGPLESTVAASVTAKISQAVAEAHRNGIALGALHPSLIRVNFDGQVRLSHVIAHGSATPDQDIRAVGALLYLMLTGTWPLPETAGGSNPLTPAPTQGGREVPVSALRPEVPLALSALASRALHPDEPDGIHAVGAIASLLRQPDAPAAPAPAEAPPAPVRAGRTLTPGERRLVKDRRIKLSIAAVMMAAFTALIIIVVASLSKQVLAAVIPPASDNAPPSTSQPSRTLTATLSTGTKAPSSSSSSSSAGSSSSSSISSTPTSTSVSPTVVLAAPVPIVAGAVYDPQGKGSKDYVDLVDRAYDNDPATAWQTFVYKQQFGPDQNIALKEGVGLLLELQKEVTVSAVQVQTLTPGVTVQIRSIASADASISLDKTTVIGSAQLASRDPVNIPVSGATKSKYIVVFVSAGAAVDGGFQGALAEISVLGA